MTDREIDGMQLLLADNDPRVRASLRWRLTLEPDLSVTAEADSATSLLTEASRGCPDAVLVDWNLVDLTPERWLAALRWRCPALVIIVISGRPEVKKAALQAGADYFISKLDPVEGLLEVLRLVRPTADSKVAN